VTVQVVDQEGAPIPQADVYFASDPAGEEVFWSAVREMANLRAPGSANAKDTRRVIFILQQA
jgi:hypothetical protein